MKGQERPSASANGRHSSIPLFSPLYRLEECLAEIRECLERGWTGLGYKTLTFEDAWKVYTALPYAHFTASGTAALHLAVRLLKESRGWRDGDEVVTTPLTFVSTNHVLLYERLRPVFADVDESLCLDPVSAESRIGPRTRAVVFVGLGGNAGQLEQVADLCRSRGIALILDGAHMAGTRIKGVHVGSQADATAFSFHAVKNLPTADSGMISFRDGELDQAARRWSWLGISKDTYSRTHSTGAYRWRYSVEHVGFKYHGNSVMAAMGLVSLRYLERDNERRRRIAAWYDDLLRDCHRATRVPMAHDCEPSRHLYQILVEERDRLMCRLNEEGVFPGVHYADNTTHPMYAYASGSCPRAREAGERLVSLPLHLRMTRKDVEQVVDAIRKHLSRGHRRAQARTRRS